MHRKHSSNKKGFTLVELMVALFLGIIATIGIYKTYVNYSAAADAQDQILEMNQNLRVIMHRMEKEIRMAGYDPADCDCVGITIANDDMIEFTWDRDEDGLVATPGERIQYQIVNDGGGTFGRLQRNDVLSGASGLQNLYENTDVVNVGTSEIPLNFRYLDEDQNTTAVLDAIRYVEISLVLRSVNEDYTYTNDVAYSNLAPTVILAAKGDNYHRRQLISKVNVRNLGLTN